MTWLGVPMRTRAELGDAMRRLVAQTDEVVIQRVVKSQIRFGLGPVHPTMNKISGRLILHGDDSRAFLTCGK